MNDLAALVYLDFHRARNYFNRAVREPARLFVWLLAVLWLGWTIFARAMSRSSASSVGIAEPFATMIGCGALLAFGILIATGASGRVGTFQNAADARFLVTSALNERTLVTWLQVRNSATALARAGLGIVLYTLFFARSHPGGAFLAMTGATIFAVMIPLPAFEAARRFGKWPVQAAGAAIAAAALVGAALAPLSHFVPAFRGVRSILLASHVGAAASLLWNGDGRSLALLFGGAAILVICGVAASTDLYPEFYAATMKSAATMRPARPWNALQRPKAGVERAISRSTSLSGVLVVFWKERLTLGRSPALRIFFAIELGIGVVGGFVAGFAGRNDPAILGSIIGGVGFILVIMLALSGTSLANDIAKPLWWAGSGSTTSKLAAWCAATSADTAFVLAAASIALALASHHAAIAAGGIVLAVVLPTLVRAIGIATYAFFPGSVDQRGPVAALRMFVIYLFFIPPGALYFASLVFLRDGKLGVFFALASFAAEGAACLAIAARRIEGRGAEYAVAESST